MEAPFIGLRGHCRLPSCICDSRTLSSCLAAPMAGLASKWILEPASPRPEAPKESRTTWESGSRSWCSAWRPTGAPRRSWTTAQSSRLRTRFLSPGSAAAAASCRSAGCPPWWGAAARPRSRSGPPCVASCSPCRSPHGLVLVVLAALQQVMHGHGAAVVVISSQGVGLPERENWHPLRNP